MKKILHSLFLFLVLLPFTGNAQCPEGETLVTVTIQTDLWGSEISWSLTGPEGTPVYLSVSEGTYNDEEMYLDVKTACVPIGAELEFTISDYYGDGICSGSGDGYYEVSIYDFIYATGCDYGDGESVTIYAIAPPDENAKLEKLDILSYVVTGNIDIKGTFSNQGANNINSIDINWKVDDGNTNTYNLTGISVSSNNNYNFTHNIPWNATGSHTIKNLKVWLSNPNGLADEEPEDDTLSKDIYILDEAAQRLVLIEHFTNASCGPCANQNPVLAALLEEGDNSSKVAHVAYHTSWPGTDPMYSFNLANDLKNARVSYYDVSGVPNAVLAGNKFQGSPASVTQELIDDEFVRPGLFNVECGVTIVNDTLKLDVDLTSLADFSSGSLKAHVVLIEDMEYSTAPGSNGEKEFPDVMRYMFPNMTGTNIGLPNHDDVINLNFEKKLDSEIGEYLQIIVFVQNEADNEIYMTYQLIEDFTYPEISIYPENGSTSIHPATNIEINFTDAIRLIDNSEIADPSSLIIFKKNNEEGENVNSVVAINSAKTKITINPTQNFDSDQVYYIGIDANVVENMFDLPNKASSSTFTTGLTLDIQDLIFSNSFGIYPNPASERITLEFNLKENCNIKVKIYNESGQLVQLADKGNVKSGDNSINIDVSKLNSGLYFMNVIFGNESITQKIQIVK